MTCEIVEHEHPASLIKVMDEIKSDDKLWGVAIINRSYLRHVTKDALLVSIRPVLETVDEAHFYFLANTTIYIIWRGKQKATYLRLLHTVSTALVRPELNVTATKIMVYNDLRTQGEEIKNFLKAQNSGLSSTLVENMFADEDDNAELPESAPENVLSLKASQEQFPIFREAKNKNPLRRNLQFLVVEDEPFSQRLLCEILRGIHLNNTNESPPIDVENNTHNAWKTFINKAPDITFIDLNLTDGSGHTLARAIKEIDASSRIVIVTSSNYQEEIEVARQNNVDFFIAKPYNKKQILDCVFSYVGLTKSLGGAKIAKLH